MSFIDNILCNIKGECKLGVNNLIADIELSVPSGEELDISNLYISSKMFNYGVIRCHGNCLLKSQGNLKLCANSVFRLVR